MAAAEKALREAALEQYRAANKWDLGQCTTEFKKCMATTAGCGTDFAACASVSAMDNTNTTKSSSKSTKNYSIKGAVSTIEISASTYDAIMAKQPICMNVTNSCVAVKGQVWDTFLREVAPQLKTAELIAENSARQDCIGNISSCFQKACKDTMDPNDPEGSYDMCLSRPETMLNVCKIPLNACGIDASSRAKAEESQIWSFVAARLAAMRVDSCTTEVKECLQSEDRCGKDYTQCVGLDTDTIIRMCPYDKLVGCQKVYSEKGQDITGDAVYDELATMVQGIMLNIDNSMMSECQKAADAAMIKVCGGTEDCNGLAVDDGIGSRSLEYKICEYSGDVSNLSINYANCRTDLSQITDNELRSNLPFSGILDGTIFWESVDFNEDGTLKSVDEYLSTIGVKLSDRETEKVKSELSQLQRSINTAVSAIESDPTVQNCMTGRSVQGLGSRTSLSNDKNASVARFPELTKQMRLIIATYALKSAKANYYAKYDELSKKMLQDYALVGERVAKIAEEDQKSIRREFARQACLGLAAGSTLPMSPAPKTGVFGKILVTLGSVVAAPFTGGLSLIAGASMMSGDARNGGVSSISSAVPDVCTAGTSDPTVPGGGLMASQNVNGWNYKETVTTTFACETMICKKCVRSQACGSIKKKFLGSRYCKAWNEETEKCTDTQF